MELYNEIKYPKIGLRRYLRDGKKLYLVVVYAPLFPSNDWWHAELNIWTTTNGWQSVIEREGRGLFLSMEEAADDILDFGLKFLETEDDS